MLNRLRTAFGLGTTFLFTFLSLSCRCEIKLFITVLLLHQDLSALWVGMLGFLDFLCLSLFFLASERSTELDGLLDQRDLVQVRIFFQLVSLLLPELHVALLLPCHSFFLLLCLAGLAHFRLVLIKLALFRPE